MSAWSDLLRTSRKERRLLQEEVRARAGISLRTLTAYERGKVRPSRDTLLKLAAALDLNRHATNTLLAGAGFDPVPTGLLSRFARRSISLAAMHREIDRCSWPCLVMGDDMTVLLWNEPATSVVEMDFAEVLPDPADRMLTRIVALDHFRSRMLNWNEFVAMMVALLKADFESPEQYAAEMPWFARLMQDLSTRPEYRDAFPEIMRLYNSAKPRSDVARTSCPVTWRHSDGTVLRFHGVLTTWDDFAALWAFDWFPADAETASWLQARADERMPRMPETPENRPESSNDVEHLLRWYELLRSAREKSGFTQAGLAQAAGIAEETLFSYENDRRRPSRSVLLRLAHAMQLDGATTNLLLSGSGHAPAASEFARSVAGLPNSDPRFRPNAGRRWPSRPRATCRPRSAAIPGRAWCSTPAASQ
jgi:transcriptional regulator with XRE-family HTH domain